MTSPCSLDVVMYLSSSTRTLCKACSLSRPQLCIHYSFIVRTTPYHGAWCVGTEQNRFRRKTDEIAKFSILDGKTEFTILDGIWSKNGQSFNRSLEKNGQNRLGGVAEIGVYIVAENGDYTNLSLQFVAVFGDAVFGDRLVHAGDYTRLVAEIAENQQRFLPRDAMHSAVMRLHVVRPSVRPSVRLFVRNVKNETCSSSPPGHKKTFLGSAELHDRPTRAIPLKILQGRSFLTRQVLCKSIHFPRRYTRKGPKR